MLNKQPNTTVLDSSGVPGLRRLYRLALTTAAVSALFCFLLIAVLLQNYHAACRPELVQRAWQLSLHDQTAQPYSSDPSYRQPASDVFNSLPTDQKDFVELKHRLAQNKDNDGLREEIRTLDQTQRIDFFKRRETIQKTAPLLLLAVVVFLISAKTALTIKRRIPIPEGDPKAKAKIQEQNRLQIGTISLVAVGMLLIGLSVGLIAMPPSTVERMLHEKALEEQAKQIAATAIRETTPKRTASGDKSGPDEVPMTATEPPLDRDALLVELEKNWPSFRGYDCSGVAKTDGASISNAPVQWDATKGENIAWQTEIPLPGKSSPVVWKTEKGERVFLTGADEEKRQIFCFDAESGKLLWTADAPSTPDSAKPFSVSDDTGFAAPTMVVDGRRAFAIFANGDLVATDFDGKILWSRSLGIPESAYGFSASPALFFDRLIVQYDVGDGSDDKSKLFAFDVRTGETVWETPREIGNSWSSPMVKKIADKYQIITCGDPFVISYDPENGQEIWRCKSLSGDVGPSPAAIGKMVFVTNQGPRTSAIDASGSGDVTETHVVWRGNNALPDTPSPVATDGRIYTFDSGGYLTAYDPTNINEKNNRAMYWELEIGGGMSNFYSSPLLVGNSLYLFSMTEDDPKGFVVDLSKAKTDDAGALDEAAAETMIVASNPMPEPCVTSPAFSNGKLYVRGSKTLFCIGTKP